MNSQPNINQDDQAQEKQKAFLKKARKGLLNYLLEQGGRLTLDEMHDYSFKKFFIQHQGFSRMMETLVNEGLVEYDYLTQTVNLTDAGKNFVSQ